MYEASDGVNNFSVLVTRPSLQAGHFCELVESAQGRAFRFPVIKITPAQGTEVIVEQIQSILPVSKIIFISANAVLQGIPLLEVADDSFLDGTQLVTIGSATTRSLEDLGYVPHITPEEPFNSEALLDLRQMQHIRDESVLMMKGQGGRGMLSKKLRERGAVVHEIELYCRDRASPDPEVFNSFMSQGNPVIAVTSVTGLEYLFDLIDSEQAHWARHTARFLVPGERVAKELRTLKIHTKPVIAPNATDQAMFDALLADAG